MKSVINSLAEVDDSDWNAHYHRMVAGLKKKMVGSGTIKAGAAVYLESVPVPFLRGSFGVIILDLVR